MAMVSDGATTNKIRELKDLMRGQPIDQKVGPFDDKILKLLGYGGRQMPQTQIRIGGIRQGLNDFARQRKEGVNSRERIAFGRERN